MAHLNITELANQGRDTNNNLLPVMQMPAITVQDIAIGASSTQASAFQSQTGCIRISCDIPCAYLVGTNPTATAQSTYMPAGTVEYLAVPVGQSFKIAVIAA